MDIENNIAQMAKEYKSALVQANYDRNDLIDRIIILEEQQLDLVTTMTCFPSRCNYNTVNYLNNVIFQSINLLYAQKKEGNYIPSYRTVKESFHPLRLRTLQIDIFLLLDKLNAIEEVSYINMLENRKMALIASLT